VIPHGVAGLGVEISLSAGFVSCIAESVVDVVGSVFVVLVHDVVELEAPIFAPGIFEVAESVADAVADVAEPQAFVYISLAFDI
jgi:hypothetical protein